MFKAEVKVKGKLGSVECVLPISRTDSVFVSFVDGSVEAVGISNINILNGRGVNKNLYLLN